MSAILSLALEFNQVSCGVCKQPFAISSTKYSRCQNFGENFFCPDGHSLVFTESEKQRFEKELAKEKQRRSWAEESRDIAQREAVEQERKTRAFKGIVTRIKNRVGAGVCPCCNRSFENLKRHMGSKHPDFRSDSKSNET